MDTSGGDLQFDVVTLRDPAPPAACTACQAAFDGEYFDVNGLAVCRRCSEVLADHGATPRGAGVLARAAALGVGAAILGALLYFTVMAVTGLEVGLIAIAIGYIVGYGVKMATRGRGGRRFQVLALVLTYWAVGLAYSSFAIKALIDERGAKTETAQQSSAATVPAEPTLEADNGPLTGTALALGLLQLLAFSFALPVIVVFTSIPGGLISGAIIAFGMMQAWRMTAAPPIRVLGPFRIGAQPQPAG